MISFAGIPKKTVVEVKKASNADIRRVITDMIPLANKQMADKSKFFKGTTEKETCENIWRFLKYKINYQADESEQIIKAPSALIRYGSGDCKSYAVFTSAALTNLGIPHSLTYASYSQDPTPQHVYVTTDSGIIIDAVWTSFNKEKKSTFKYNKKMNVKGITGTNVLMGSIGDTEKRPTVHAVALAGLAVPRNAFLVLVRLNIAGIASVINLRLAQAWDLHNKARKTGTPQFVSELFNKWYNMGGNPDALQSAITAGEAKKIAGIKLINILRKKDPSRTGRYFTLLAQTIDFYKQKRGIDLSVRKGVRGIGGATTTAAATAAAAIPVWLQVLAILAPVAIAAMGGSQQRQLEETYDDGSTNQGGESDPTSQGGLDLKKYAGIAVALGVAAYFLTKNKK